MKYLNALLLGIILVVAITLRFWQLGFVPISPDWDEAALGYNAYSILHTGRDEYGKFLPVVLESFGDYKPALYSYITIPSVGVFGLNTFAVRLPSALCGILAVLLIYLLAKELFKKESIALLSSLLLAIAPWHIQFSRVAFEANVGLTLNMLGAWLFLKGLKKPWLLAFCTSVFALSLYAYQSEKVFTPLLLFSFVLIYWQNLKKIGKKYITVALISGVITIMPLGIYTLSQSNSLSRAVGVSIFQENFPAKTMNALTYTINKSEHNHLGLYVDNQKIFYVREFIGNYIAHFDINWLFITGDQARHHAPGVGLLYLWTLPFLLIGIYELFFGRHTKRTKILIIAWFLLGPLPAAVTFDVPHAVRTLNSVAMYQIFIALGLLYAFDFMRKRKVMWWIVVGIFSCFIILNSVYYVDQYFVQQNYYVTSDWQYGYQQLIEDTQLIGKNYQTIVVSNVSPFDQSYIFYLFYMQYPPSRYQARNMQSQDAIHNFGKFQFRPIDWNKDKRIKNTLFIGPNNDFPNVVSGVQKIIRNGNGSIIAKIVGT